MKRNGRLTGGTETVRMVSTNKPGTKRDGKCESGSVIFEVVSDKIKKLHLLRERHAAAREGTEETAGTLSKTREKKFMMRAVFLYINASGRRRTAHKPFTKKREIERNDIRGYVRTRCACRTWHTPGTFLV
jgi:hypothetical protein